MPGGPGYTIPNKYSWAGDPSPQFAYNYCKGARDVGQGHKMIPIFNKRPPS